MVQPLPYRSYPPATPSVLHPPAPPRSNMRPETVGEMGTIMSLKPERYPTKAMEVPCPVNGTVLKYLQLVFGVANGHALFRGDWYE